MSGITVNIADFVGVLWLFMCWNGYAYFARRRAKEVFCISSVLQHYRKQWMNAMLTRENRIADASLLTNLERNVSFLASTSIFVIAGLITSLASTDKIHQLFQTVPILNMGMTALQLQFKIVLLLMIHVYAFFTFTWAMRQYGFCAVLVGAAPVTSDPGVKTEYGKNYARHLSKVIDQAGHSYNDGLRAYYFSLSVLAWSVNIVCFMFAVAFVVGILYAREFHSKSLKAMIQVGRLER